MLTTNRDIVVIAWKVFLIVLLIELFIYLTRHHSLTNNTDLAIIS